MLWLTQRSISALDYGSRTLSPVLSSSKIAPAQTNVTYVDSEIEAHFDESTNEPVTVVDSQPTWLFVVFVRSEQHSRP